MKDVLIGILLDAKPLLHPSTNLLRLTIFLGLKVIFYLQKF